MISGANDEKHIFFSITEIHELREKVYAIAVVVLILDFGVIL